MQKVADIMYLASDKGLVDAAQINEILGVRGHWEICTSPKAVRRNSSTEHIEGPVAEDADIETLSGSWR